MIICDVVEKVNFFFLQEKAGGDGVNRSITPTLIEESAVLVKTLEVVCVCLRPKPVKIADFKI